MSNQALARETAAEILEILVNHFMLKPGDVQLVGVFLRVWQGRGHDEDAFAPGLEHAEAEGWVRSVPGGESFELTQAGFDFV